MADPVHPPLVERLAARVLAGPDPAHAEARLARFVEAAAQADGGLPACVPDERAEDLLVLLVGQSGWLSRALVRDPPSLARLARDPYLEREKPPSVLADDLAAELATNSDPASALRRFRNADYLRLGARELGYGPAREVAREVAQLASACLDGAVAIALRETTARLGEPLTWEPATDENGGVASAPRRCRFVVMGMGKLGGEELNFSSDVDLIYLYESDAGGAAGGASLHEFFTRVSERTTRLVADTTDEGACFRVDLRLRPEGSRGPLCNSLLAAERYYETWGRAWERQAWLKARPVAGDLDLGQEALALLEPFVWPRLVGADAIDAVLDLMGRIRAELATDDDVKVGPGGIREVEFFAQALQRLHGGRIRELRERGTLTALDRLLFAGFVSDREHRALGDAYVFLRRVEHRLQLDELLQTHAVPPRGERRELLARRLGFDDGPAFEQALDGHRRQVSAIFATLGQPPPGPPPEVAVLLDAASDRAAIESALLALGFRDAESAAEEIELLRRKPRGPFSQSASPDKARVAAVLLHEASRSPDPDQALRRLVDLAGRGNLGASVWALVEASPPVGRILASLFGTSDFLSKRLVQYPELVEPLLASRWSRTLPTTEEIVPEIAQRLEGIDRGEEHDEEARLNALRRWRNEQVLRVGLLDVGGRVESEEVCEALTVLADACLQSTLDAVTPGVFARWGRPRTTFAVIGLGKLGGRELTYSSDLDLVFVFGDEDAPVDGGRATSAFEATSRLAQAIIRGLGAFMEEGRLYEVDTRLRPSGQQGALVSSLAGFASYHQGEAALWERQALIKARTVAGDPELGRRVEAIAARHVWEGPPLDPVRTAEEIGRLRARMERELAREGKGRFDFKVGRGGISDVEFLVQYLQLVHGPARAALRKRATLDALAALRDERLVDESDFAELHASFRFLRRLENRVRIVHDRPISQLREDPYEIDKLARRLGMRDASPGARLLDEYRARTARIRSIYARYLPAPEGG